MVTKPGSAATAQLSHHLTPDVAGNPAQHQVLFIKAAVLLKKVKNDNNNSNHQDNSNERDNNEDHNRCNFLRSWLGTTPSQSFKKSSENVKQNTYSESSRIVCEWNGV